LIFQIKDSFIINSNLNNGFDSYIIKENDETIFYIQVFKNLTIFFFSKIFNLIFLGLTEEN
jgi:hypothetical protein